MPIRPQKNSHLCNKSIVVLDWVHLSFYFITVRTVCWYCQ